ncbi:aldehyde dehydrogenase family protein, partial [Micrococcus sp. SIMBA_131]
GVSYKDLISPYSGDVLAEIPMANEADVDSAIEAAYRAKRVMRKLPAHERASILERFVQKLSERADEAAEIIALEAAKPIATAKGEVARTIATYKFAAEEAKRIQG